MRITLKAARVNAGYTQGQAANILGVDRGTLIKWERGDTKPTYDKCLEMADLYNWPLQFIIMPKESTKQQKSVQN